MTTPQDLADRLEKAIKILPGAIVSRVCDLEGYTSPDDQPDLLQCTTGELEACAENAVHQALHELLASIRRSAPASGEMGEADSVVPIGTRWRHLKTGHLVTITGTCRLEATNDPAYLYDHDGVIWARSMDEFLDGRFVKIARTPSGETREEAGL